MRDMLIDLKLDDYVQSLSTAFTPTLGEMEEYAYQNDFPIVGPQVGRLLYLLTTLHRPGSIFELGSGYGYSTMWFALAAADGCVIHHTDTSERAIAAARAYFAKAGITRPIVYHQADGTDALASLGEAGERFDIIFCDVDKEQYPRAFAAAKRYLSPRGLFIADNILWGGRVADEAFSDDRPTAAIKEALRLFTGDPAFFTSILSVRDGVLVATRR